MFVGECHVDCCQFSVPQIDRKSKQVKEEWHGKCFLQPVWRATRYFKHRKYQNLWINDKVRGDTIRLHFLPHLLNIGRKFVFLISQGNILKVRLVLPYEFCSKFHALSNSAKCWKSVKIWQSYRVFKGGIFSECKFFSVNSKDYRPEIDITWKECVCVFCSYKWLDLGGGGVDLEFRRREEIAHSLRTTGQILMQCTGWWILLGSITKNKNGHIWPRPVTLGAIFVHFQCFGDGARNGSPQICDLSGNTF